MDSKVKEFLDDLREMDTKYPDFHYSLRVWMTLMCGNSIDCFGSLAYAFIRRFGKMNNEQKSIIFKELLENIKNITKHKIDSYNL